MTDGVLAVDVATLRFRNPILLAAGTAGYGSELEGVVDLDALGGIVTKAVSLEPRAGAPEPRVAEFEGGMINAVGLANPGLAEVSRVHVPWLASHHSQTRKLFNVVGFSTDEFAAVIRGLENAAASSPAAIDGYEPDGITVINTIPGLVIDVDRRKPAVGFGTGGVSGRAILPVGVLATWRVSRAVKLPVIGLGGVTEATDALQYIIAGASLVGVGTAALRDPRSPERIVRDLSRWCEQHRVRSLSELRGSLEWPS
jgi:dihydroorotate dehydrogenase (NAD+) catalytic subunit